MPGPACASSASSPRWRSDRCAPLVGARRMPLRKGGEIGDDDPRNRGGGPSPVCSAIRRRCHSVPSDRTSVRGESGLLQQSHLCRQSTGSGGALHRLPYRTGRLRQRLHPSSAACCASPPPTSARSSALASVQSKPASLERILGADAQLGVQPAINATWPVFATRRRAEADDRGGSVHLRWT